MFLLCYGVRINPVGRVVCSLAEASFGVIGGGRVVCSLPEPSFSCLAPALVILHSGALFLVALAPKTQSWILKVLEEWSAVL